MRKPQDVQEAVENIKRLMNNPVAAHAAEDNLYYAILLAIANGEAEAIQKMCKLAIKTQSIQFKRSYHDKDQQ